MRIELIVSNVSLNEKFTKPFEKELNEKLGIGKITSSEISEIGKELCLNFVRELYDNTRLATVGDD